MFSAPSGRPRFCLRCHRKWTSNDRGRYIELKRGILCIDCHRKITGKLEQLKTRYVAARRGILQPSAKQPLPSMKREMKKATQPVG